MCSVRVECPAPGCSPQEDAYPVHLHVNMVANNTLHQDDSSMKAMGSRVFRQHFPDFALTNLGGDASPDFRKESK